MSVGNGATRANTQWYMGLLSPMAMCISAESFSCASTKLSGRAIESLSSAGRYEAIHSWRGRGAGVFEGKGEAVGVTVAALVAVTATGVAVVGGVPAHPSARDKKIRTRAKPGK